MSYTGRAFPFTPCCGDQYERKPKGHSNQEGLVMKKQIPKVALGGNHTPHPGPSLGMINTQHLILNVGLSFHSLNAFLLIIAYSKLFPKQKRTKHLFNEGKHTGHSTHVTENNSYGDSSLLLLKASGN